MNNYETCDHKRNPDGGHCYMFRNEPEGVCMQHTDNKPKSLPFGRSMLLAAAIASVIQRNSEGEASNG